MNHSTLAKSMIAVAVVAVVFGSARGDDVAPPPLPNGASIQIRGLFTGTDEPRPGELLSGKPIGPARVERAAFLGVGAIPIDAALRAQLDLPKGIGLTVGFIEKDSPAALAGVQQHDVLQKLNDQLIINAPQLATLVRTFKGGDEVSLAIIRKGKPMDLKAKLVERDLPPLADAGDPFTINFATEPMRIERFALPNGEIEDFQRVAKNAEEAIKRAQSVITSHENGARIIRVSPDSTRIISRDDGTNNIQLTEQGSSTSLTIKDAAGATVFDGPYNTPEEQAKLSPELREKVKRITDGIDFKPATPTTGPSGPKAAVDELLNRLSTSGAAT